MFAFGQELALAHVSAFLTCCVSVNGLLCLFLAYSVWFGLLDCLLFGCVVFGIKKGVLKTNKRQSHEKNKE